MQAVYPSPKWIVIASGPSMLHVDMQHVQEAADRGWRVLTVNNAWKLAPRAHVHYAADLCWWDAYAGECRAAGQRWTADHHAAARYGLRRITCRSGIGLCRTPGQVYAGGNSGYQAINLAYHLGMRHGILLGFDMRRQQGEPGHFDGEHPEPMISAPENQIAAWLARFPALARDLRHEGVAVVNCTPGSALDCFPAMTLQEAIRREC